MSTSAPIDHDPSAANKIHAAVWRSRAIDPKAVAQLSTSLNLSRPLAQVLAARNINDVKSAELFLQPSLKALPDPDALAGIPAALERIARAIRQNETIGIFGDYDVDGVTSTTIMWDFLEKCQADVISTLPDRLKEGYGLSRAGVDRLADGGATLIITVDCGITAHEEVIYACNKGVDVVVIDHHTVEVTLPKAVSVINPHRKDCTRGSQMLCAAGVTFNLCLSLRRHLRSLGFFHPVTRPEPDLRESLDLVALGTVADVMPLITENRILVANGLNYIRQSKRKGITALLDVAKTNRDRIGGSTLGFQLGPRVNAAGRLGNAMVAVELLRCDDPVRAQELAEFLDNENQARRSLEHQMVQESIQLIDSSPELSNAHVLVVGDPDWHPGVIGIVASRLMERYNRPTFVIGSEGKGSGRSIEAFHLYDGLVATQSTLKRFGGHAHAAGLALPSGDFKTTLNRFRDAMMEHGKKVIAPEKLHRVYTYDGDVTPAEITVQMCQDLEKAAPYGRGNAEPVFRVADATISSTRPIKNGHLKFYVGDKPRVDAIFFRGVERMEDIGETSHVLATPELNEWQQRVTPQLRVKDVKRTSDAPPRM